MNRHCIATNQTLRLRGPKQPLALWLAILAGTASLLRAQTSNPLPLLAIQGNTVAANVSPTLYGMMTEEINFSYEGGLYGELLRNRSFKANPTNAVYWTLIQDDGAAASISLDTNTPLNEALNTSLKLEVSQANPKQQAGIANGGYWGIPVRPKTRYRASFYAKAAAGFSGPLTVSLVSSNRATVFAHAAVARLTDQWRKYELTLTTSKVAPSADNLLLVSAQSPGTLWLSQVSLFPPTYKKRPNGNRPDLMRLMADLHPKFLRFPGGNYLEGNTVPTRFDWKKTIGDPARRPGHLNDGWRYWSTDGLGLLEFLEWCEDLGMEPVLAVYAGYSMRQQHITPGPDLEPYVQDALDEIEYVSGSAQTTWGARRVQDGHPAPFKLRYVEVGNEDWFDRSGSYPQRFAQYYDALKAKYPALQVIATTPVTNRAADIIDEHFYRTEMESELHAHDYDTRSRSGPKVFVGEWATRVGSPTPNLTGALGDAAWMTGMERNSDLVIMSCYAPLFVNVNPGAMQWKTDLIGYDAMRSYGSPAYYAQKMFSLNHGEVVVPVASQNIPTREYQPPARRRDGQTPPPPPAPRQVPTLFFNATRSAKPGTLYIKIVNVAGAPQPVEIDIAGLANVSAKGKLIQMCGASPDDTNSITEPEKVVPVTSRIDGLGAHFTRTFPPYSITVLVLDAK